MLRRSPTSISRSRSAPAFPATSTFHPLPAEIVTIYPEWRGYEFILVNDQIMVIDPAHVRDRRRPRRLIACQRDIEGAGRKPAPFRAPICPEPADAPVRAPIP